MPYTPTVWETGDVITAEKLNNIENGVEKLYRTYIEYVTISATRDATSNAVTANVDKTWDELLALVESHVTVIAVLDLTVSNGLKYRAKTTLEVNIDSDDGVTSLGCCYISAHAGANASTMVINTYHFDITPDSITGDYSRKTS